MLTCNCHMIIAELCEKRLKSHKTNTYNGAVILSPENLGKKKSGGIQNYSTMRNCSFPLILLGEE